MGAGREADEWQPPDSVPLSVGCQGALGGAIAFPIAVVLLVLGQRWVLFGICAAGFACLTIARLYLAYRAGSGGPPESSN